LPELTYIVSVQNRSLPQRQRHRQMFRLD